MLRTCDSNVIRFPAQAFRRDDDAGFRAVRGGKRGIVVTSSPEAIAEGLARMTANQEASGFDIEAQRRADLAALFRRREAAGFKTDLSDAAVIRSDADEGGQRPDYVTAEEFARAKVKRARTPAKTDNALPLTDFIAHSPDHTYIHRPTSETWTSSAVKSRVRPVANGRGQKAISATTWLDQNDAVEQRVWAPGEPEIIADQLVAEGGFFPKQDARVFNLYRPPTIIRTPGDVAFWRDHLRALWPAEQATHIERWLAHRVQRPGEKINHALVLGGKPGVGKDALLAPVRLAVGPWNFTEISPQAVLSAFNEFAQAVVLRISEAKDLGEFDRFAFYEATKTLIAAPPDTLRINPKFVKPYYVLNVVGVIIPTNHMALGIYIPADDRRHYVAWSHVEPAQFGGDYFPRYFAAVDRNAGAVASHLAALDLRAFNPKAPPPRTPAFHEIVAAYRATEHAEMLDVIEALGHPQALIVSDIIARASSRDMWQFHAFLTDRKNSRVVGARLHDCGYRRLDNPDEIQGRWVIGRERTGVYVLKTMTDQEGFTAARNLAAERRNT